jgi:hypothetical protein
VLKRDISAVFLQILEFSPKLEGRPIFPTRFGGLFAWRSRLLSACSWRTLGLSVVRIPRRPIHPCPKSVFRRQTTRYGQSDGSLLLRERILIEAFELNGPADSDPDTVLHHHCGQAFPVDQNDAQRDPRCEVDGLDRERGGRYENPAPLVLQLLGPERPRKRVHQRRIGSRNNQREARAYAAA